MCRFPTLRLVVLAVAVAVGGPGHGSELTDTPKLRTSLLPRKATRPADLASEFVQRTPEFVLWDADQKISPSAAGCVYVVEQSAGNRLLLSDLNEGRRGWVFAGTVVSLEPGGVVLLSADPHQPRERVRVPDERGRPLRE